MKNEREGWRVNKELASLNWSLEGDVYIDLKGKYVTMLRDVKWEKPQFVYRFPFAYMLAFTSGLKSEENNDLPQPNLKSESDFYQQLYDYRKELVGEKPLFEEQAYLKLITVLSWRLKQRWFNPIIDYSVGYEGVYNCIPAWRLLTSKDFLEEGKKQKCEVSKIDGSIKERIIIIASGGYDEAEDTINNPPLAFRYRSGKRKLTGGEVHAYTLHHLLANRLVISIPDFFVVLAAVFLGRNVALIMENYRERLPLLGTALIAVNLIYVAVSLQFYISKAILLPIILPSLAFWFCIKPANLFNKGRID
ncbi:MAG: hypothetical protein F6K35_43760 [Okeania sp. SIO2H7]|nr:hypothetical protein [Okeania sp. SIO2H7]